MIPDLDPLFPHTHTHKLSACLLLVADADTERGTQTHVCVPRSPCDVPDVTIRSLLLRVRSLRASSTIDDASSFPAFCSLRLKCCRDHQEKREKKKEKTKAEAKTQLDATPNPDQSFHFSTLLTRALATLSLLASVRRLLLLVCGSCILQQAWLRPEVGHRFIGTSFSSHSVLRSFPPLHNASCRN